jgi:starch synthase
MIKPRILFATQAIMPYSSESEIAHVSRYLPQQIQDMGYEFRLFMPCFGNINARRHQLHEVIRLGGTNFYIGGDAYPLIIKAASITTARIQIYFTDNEDCFKHKDAERDQEGVFYPDNDKRMILFALGTLHTIKKQLWQPLIVHCHGWFSMLLPLYLKKVLRKDPFFGNIKIVVSLYDDVFEEEFGPDFIKHASITGIRSRDLELMQQPNCTNLMKLAIANADGVIVVGEKTSLEVLEYITKRKKPILRIKNSELNPKMYANFYANLIQS